jgi:hypothetical protein
MGRKRIGTRCLLVTIALADGITWAAPQAQQQRPQFTQAEYDRFQAERKERDPQIRLKLLNDLENDFPNSIFRNTLYHDTFVVLYELKNYPKTIEYADKLLAFEDKNPNLGDRVAGLGMRVTAFCVGSNDNLFQTSDDTTKERDAATRGIETLKQWRTYGNMDEEHLAPSKEYLGKLFSSVLEFADARLRGDKSISCKLPPPVPPPPMVSTGFDHMVEGIKREEQKNPPVR